MPVRRILAALPFALTASFLGCSGGSTSAPVVTPPVVAVPVITTNAAVTAKNIYSVATGAAVAVYTADLSGTVSPTATYAAAATAVAGDSAGDIYIGAITTTLSMVQFYPSGSTTATRTITIPDGGAANNQIKTMTVDASGNLYVAMPSIIYVFSPTASGSAPPTRTLTGALTQLVNVSQMVTNAAGNLYVATPGVYPAVQLVEFAPGATGNVAPVIVTGSTYYPTGVTLDAAENIYISQSLGTIGGGSYQPAIYEFTKGAVAGATPIRAITGGNTGFAIYLGDLAVDNAGNIFLHIIPSAQQNYSDFLVFSATATGNVAPASALNTGEISTGLQFFLR